MMAQTTLEAAERVDWSAVEREFDSWEAEGLTLPVWWRDDDAIEPTPALDELLGRAAAESAPLAIASIPTGATPALAERLSREKGVSVLVHGWTHVSHAPADQKKAEFGAHRPVAEMIEEARQALETIERVFGSQAVRCFTPPWNRISPDLVAALPGLGYESLSTFGSRDQTEPAPGLVQINTHIDPIHFKGRPCLKPPALLAQRIAENLRRRRMDASGRGVAGRVLSAASGSASLKRKAKRFVEAAKGKDRADNAEPFGFLTHHLVHDETIWRFVDEWLGLLKRRSAVIRWVDMRDAVAPRR